jgi:hypothetical protein
LATATLPFTTTPYFMQAVAGDPDIYYTAADFRRFFLAVKRRPGVLGSLDFGVHQADVVGWSIKITGGYAHVAGSANSYLAYLTPTSTISLAGFNTSPPAARTHKVFIAVYDKLISGSLYQGQIVVTEDVDGSGAPAPSGAVAYLLLANVFINKGQANIQDANIKNIADHGGSSGVYYDLTAGMINPGYQSVATIVDSAPPRAIYHDGYIRLSGAIGRTSGALFDAGSVYDILSLWPSIRPRYKVRLTCGVDKGGYTAQISIDTDGTTRLYIPGKVGTTTYTTANWIYLDGLTYDMD